MSTISTVTDRVDGEVLTAAKYNTDHGVHETNATNLNTGKVEISNYNTEHGPTGAHSADQVRDSIGLATSDQVTFKVVTADQFFASGDAPATPSVKALYQDLIPKAWLMQAGTTVPVISGDVNISSITDTGVGVRTPSFATVMGNINYSCAGSMGQSTSVSRLALIGRSTTTNYEITLVAIDSVTNPTEVDESSSSSVFGSN